MTTAGAIQVAATFVWLGMILAISFLEAPLKFRAPGITIPLGVGIGRLVFRALNIAEIVWALVIGGTLLAAPADVSAARWWLLGILVVVLALSAGLVRPLMDRRVRGGHISEGVPRTLLHVGYIVLEIAKVALLISFGVLALQT